MRSWASTRRHSKAGSRGEANCRIPRARRPNSARPSTSSTRRSPTIRARGSCEDRLPRVARPAGRAEGGFGDFKRIGVPTLVLQRNPMTLFDGGIEVPKPLGPGRPPAGNYVSRARAAAPSITTRHNAITTTSPRIIGALVTDGGQRSAGVVYLFEQNVDFAKRGRLVRCQPPPRKHVCRRCGQAGHGGMGRAPDRRTSAGDNPAQATKTPGTQP